MNRRAKFAYRYIIIGLVLFLTGLIVFLNQHLNLSKSLKDTSSPSARASQVNLSQLHLFLTKSISHNNRELIHLNWYCQIKYSERHAAPHASHESEYVDSAPPKYLETIEIDLGHSSFVRYTLNIFSFMICSTEIVYLGFIIWVCVFSAILTLFGCVRFYKYDIKLLEAANKAAANANSLNDSSSENLMAHAKVEMVKDRSESLVVMATEKAPSNWCCCSSLFRKTSEPANLQSSPEKSSHSLNGEASKSSISRLKNSFSSESNINFLAYMNNFKSFYNISQENNASTNKENTESKVAANSSLKEEDEGESGLPKTPSFARLVSLPPVVPLRSSHRKLKRIAPISPILRKTNTYSRQTSFAESNDSATQLTRSYVTSCRRPTPLVNSFVSLERCSAFNAYSKSPSYRVETQIRQLNAVVTAPSVSASASSQHKPESKENFICLDKYVGQKTKFDEKLLQIFNNNSISNNQRRNQSQTNRVSANHVKPPVRISKPNQYHYSTNEPVKPQCVTASQADKLTHSLDYN